MIAKLNDLVGRSTFDRRRAEAMGFVFDHVEVIEPPNDFGVLVRGNFTCVCGTPEAFTYAVGDIALANLMRDRSTLFEFFDPAARLRKQGSFSRKHLLADGYSSERVEELVRIFEEYRE